jgi:hypothetical protein
MSTPTKEEKIWMRKVEKLLSNPPSERVGLFTIGDRSLTVYDKTFDEQIDRLQDRNYDFCRAVDDLDVGLGTIESAVNIHSTAG